MKKPDVNPVEVDMVPLIDIISLLLMFLIIVGDSAANSTSIKMKLPVADQAKVEDQWPGMETKNLIVIQLAKKDNDRYYAVINNIQYNPEEGAGKTLKDHLARTIDEAASKNQITKRADGTWSMPVKMRIPEDTPMLEVEKVLATVANLQLVDIQYAASKK